MWLPVSISIVGATLSDATLPVLIMDFMDSMNLGTKVPTGAPVLAVDVDVETNASSEDRK